MRPPSKTEEVVKRSTALIGHPARAAAIKKAEKIARAKARDAHWAVQLLWDEKKVGQGKVESGKVVREVRRKGGRRVGERRKIQAGGAGKTQKGYGKGKVAEGKRE